MFRRHFKEVSSREIGQYIADLVRARGDKRFSVICVGTPIVAFDMLGPLLGSLLLETCPDILLEGTLWRPVTAAHVAGVAAVAAEMPHTVVAVDSALSKYMDRIGEITIEAKPLEPGTGVGKALPSIGDISIAGTVGISGQNAAYELVYDMAVVLARALAYAHLILATEGGDDDENRY